MLYLHKERASLVAQTVKNLPAMWMTWVRSLGSLPGLGRSPGGGHGNPLQYSCLENLHGQRNLAGYSPWGQKELDTTEQLSTPQCHLRSPVPKGREVLKPQVLVGEQFNSEEPGL